MSAAKSVVSLLVGISIDRGMIGGADGTVLSYFPDYRVRRGEKTIYDVTIRHLLAMCAPYRRKIQPDHEITSVNHTLQQLHCSRQLQRVLKKLYENGSLQKTGRGRYRLSER